MERLLGPNLEVIVSLNEGKDFGFLSAPFVIVASLDGNAIETNYFAAEQTIKFNSELIWLSNKSNIKKMKNFKVPIRLDFYKIEVNNARMHFGYIILSLKTAQYVPKGAYVALREDSIKVIGLGKEAKGSNPLVNLSLRIQDVEENEGILSARREDEIKDTEECIESESSIVVRFPEEPPSPLKSIAKNNSQCFLQRETLVTDAKVTNEIEAYHSIHVEIELDEIKWLSSFCDVHLRFHHARGDVSWSAHSDIRAVEGGDVTNMRNVSAHLRFLEVPDHIAALLKEVPPVVSICTMRHGRPIVLSKSSLQMPSLKEGYLAATAELKDLKSQNAVATLSYNAKIKDMGPQNFKQLCLDRSEECISERVKDELELWKEKEKAAMEDECTRRLHLELSELQRAWESGRKELENEATMRMDECRRLGEALLQATEDVKTREKECEEREKSLEKTKKELENGYRSLVSETRQETASLREDLLERLKEKDKIINDLRTEEENLRKELNEVKLQTVALTREQTETLLQDMKKLHEKLEKTKCSKQFFKEQWGRAVRELHRIKTDGWKDIQVQLHYKKEELKQMGLEHLLHPENTGNFEMNQGDQGTDEKLRKLIEDRDFLLLSEGGNVNNEELSRLNREIRQLLEL